MPDLRGVPFRTAKGNTKAPFVRLDRALAVWCAGPGGGVVHANSPRAHSQGECRVIGLCRPAEAMA